MKTYALIHRDGLISGLWAERARQRPRLAAMLRGFAARIEQRRALAGLEPHLLRDIGIDADDARNEAEKPFWQP